MNADVKLLDLKEFLYMSQTLNWKDAASTMQTLRLHRFDVMSWLMMNGVAIPAELLSDETHSQKSILK